MKCINAEKLKALVKRQIRWENLNFAALGGGGQTFCINTLEWILKQIDSLQQEQPELPGIDERGIPGKDYIPVEWVDACERYGKWKIVQQEQPNDLASLISEATTVAKRIVDRDSFYNSLPQNLRNKYTFNAWCEILETFSTMKEQVQPEMDLEEEDELEREINNAGMAMTEHNPSWKEVEQFDRHFYELGKNARKEE